VKIAYIGNFDPPYSTENDVRKAFEYLGHEVIQLQENRTTLQQLRNVALNSDMLLITGTYGALYTLNDFIQVMYELAKANIPTATLHLDIFWGTHREGRKWWLEPMFHTAYLFTADGDHQKEWKAFGKNHIWLPPAVRHDAAHFGKEQPMYDCDVAFVGSNGRGYHKDVWKYRTELVDQLRIICKRNEWTFKNPGGDSPKVDRDDKLNDFYASTKIVIGDSLCLEKEDSKYWSDRVPETLGRGGFLIMPQIDELERFWPELPMYPWGDWATLEIIMRQWMLWSNDREELRKTNQQITTEDHTYVNRVKTILKEVGLV
jgi:hypothetical protein